MMQPHNEIDGRTPTDGMPYYCIAPGCIRVYGDTHCAETHCELESVETARKRQQDSLHSAMKTSDQETTTVSGRIRVLESGAKVFGGIVDGSVVWRFTSVGGGVTDLCLSQSAMRAVISIYQEILGCDPMFAAVAVDQAEQGKPGAGE